MKFLSAANLLVLTAPLANAAAFSLFDPTQATLKTNDNEKFPVNGDNPLQYCAKPDSYKLEIESVDLAPNPPLPYVNCSVKLMGMTNISMTIEDRS
jgi:hypothetical protein